MLGVVYKDIKIGAKSMIIFLCLLVFLNASTLTALAIPEENGDPANVFGALFGLSFAVMSFLSGGMLEDSIPAFDERKKWAYFISSTEDGIKNEVGSKYILAFLFSMATAFICIFFNLLAMDISSENSISISGFVIILFFFQLLVRAISFPFLFAFGSIVGNIVRIISMISIIFIVSIYFLFGDISGFDLDGIYDRLISLLTDMNENHKLLWMQAAGMGIVPVLYVLSYKLSCKLYLRGVENYDK